MFNPLNIYLEPLKLNATPEKDNLPLELKKLWENGLFRSIFLLLIVVLGVFIFQKVLIFGLRTDQPLATPISGSMEPTLDIGDLLVVQGVKANDIIAGPNPNGTIIVFRNPRDPNGIPIVHRVIDKYQVGDSWYFVTKGDNNRYPDDWSGYGFPRGGIYDKGGVPESYLFGKVIWRIPLLGYVKIYLGTPAGMVITILLLVVLLFLENMTSSERIEKPQTMEKVNGD